MTTGLFEELSTVRNFYPNKRYGEYFQETSEEERIVDFWISFLTDLKAGYRNTPKKERPWYLDSLYPDEHPGGFNLRAWVDASKKQSTGEPTEQNGVSAH